ncbi:MAG: histidinol dehydrogenase [bacterium]
MKILSFKDQKNFSKEVNRLINRFSFFDADLEEKVAGILRRVRQEGDLALLAYSQEFDGVSLKGEELLVSRDERERARQQVRSEDLAAIELSIGRVRDFHSRQKKESWFFSGEDGIMLGQLITPLESIGLYVPGGKASYPSSVVMGAVPAQMAGVKDIVLVSPPAKDKVLPPHTLAAADLLGIDKIYRVGGAQAIAALAFGTESVPRVQKIVGPGNIFVTMAKKQVFGLVDIDMVAGPSEVLILADGSANPEYIAADLLSQAEHDERAVTMMVTPEAGLVKQVEQKISLQVKELTRHEIASRSLQDYGYLIQTKDMEEAVCLVNELAAEHLILAVENPFSLLPHLRNAGSIFLGHFTPEPLGDYLAGPNHILPTSGTARFFSSLGVDDFCKRSGFTFFSRRGLEKLGPCAIALAEIEGLTAHAAAVRRRLSGK